MMSQEAALRTAVFIVVALSITEADEIPRFTRHPQSAIIRETSRVSLRCEVTPNTTSIHWLYNNRRVKSSAPNVHINGGNLVIKSFQNSTTEEPGSEGTYRCVASNTIGTLLSQAATLSAAYIGDFYEDQHDVYNNITVGNVALIQCPPISGRPRPEIYFELNGTRLDTEKDGYYVLPSGGLQIANVTPRHSGLYRCVARNPISDETKRAKYRVHLNVITPMVDHPPEFHLVPPLQLKAVRGDNLTLGCVVEGAPVPVVTWSKYGGKLPQGRYRQVLGNLQLYNIGRLDEGTYICTAHNSVGPQQVAISELNIQEPPSLLVAPTSQHVALTTRAEFTCQGRGKPAVTVQWYHNGRRLRSGKGIIIVNDTTLTIRRVQTKHIGIYQCFLENDFGAISGAAQLTVVTGHHGADTDRSKKRREQNEKMQGIAPDADSSERQNAEQKNLSQDGMTDEELDRVGGATEKPDAIIAIEDDDPRETELIPPSRPDVIKLSDTSVMLEWDVPDNNGLPVTFFKVQYKELIADKQRRRWHTIDEDIPSHVRQFELMDLKPGSTYRFRIVAVYSNNDNKHGPNSRKFTMTTSTAVRPRIPLDEPVIVEAKPLSENTIALKWQYIPEEWTPFDGFTIYYQIYGSDDEPRTITVHGSHVRETEINQLLPNTVYTIRMKSFNLGGESQFSNTVVRGTLTPSDIDDYDLYPEFDNGYRGNDQSHLTDWPLLLPGRTSTVASPSPDFDMARNTHESNRLLYIILGCVLGILVIFLLFCMAMCAWKQRQQAQMFGGRNKFQDQSRTIYADGNIRQKQLNGNGLLLNGLNGLSVQSNNLTNGHSATFGYRHMNITSNPLTENTSSSSTHLNYTSDVNSMQYVERSATRPSPGSVTYDPNESDREMVTFGRSQGRQPGYIRDVDHLYDQPPDYPSVGSRKSRDRGSVPSPQMSIHSQSSSSYRVHDPYMTDHIPRSHDHPQHRPAVRSVQGRRWAEQEHDTLSLASPKHTRHRSDNSHQSITDQSVNTDNENTHSCDGTPEQALTTGNSHPKQCVRKDHNSHVQSSEQIASNTDDDDDDSDGDGINSGMHSGYHLVDTKSDDIDDDIVNSADDDDDDDDHDDGVCQSTANVPSSVPHITRVPHLQDYPDTDPED